MRNSTDDESNFPQFDDKKCCVEAQIANYQLSNGSDGEYGDDQTQLTQSNDLDVRCCLVREEVKTGSDEDFLPIFCPEVEIE